MTSQYTTLDESQARDMQVLPFFDEEPHRDCTAEFMWCFHCERAFQHGEPREGESKATCPYVGCEEARAEPWNWMRVRGLNPEYPGQPTQGVVYPLFGRGTYVRR